MGDEFLKLKNVRSNENEKNPQTKKALKKNKNVFIVMILIVSLTVEENLYYY